MYTWKDSFDEEYADIATQITDVTDLNHIRFAGAGFTDPVVIRNMAIIYGHTTSRFESTYYSGFVRTFNYKQSWLGMSTLYEDSNDSDTFSFMCLPLLT